MKKLVVAALVLGLVGIAAAGALHINKSLCNGVCPLTGKPIAHHTAPSVDSTAVGFAGTSIPAESSGCPMAAAKAAAAAEQCPAESAECQTKCEDRQDLDCCKKKVECGKCKHQEEPATTKP